MMTTIDEEMDIDGDKDAEDGHDGDNGGGGGGGGGGGIGGDGDGDDDDDGGGGGAGAGAGAAAGDKPPPPPPIPKGLPCSPPLSLTADTDAATRLCMFPLCHQFMTAGLVTSGDAKGSSDSSGILPHQTHRPPAWFGLPRVSAIAGHVVTSKPDGKLSVLGRSVCRLLLLLVVVVVVVVLLLLLLMMMLTSAWNVRA